MSAFLHTSSSSSPLYSVAPYARCKSSMLHPLEAASAQHGVRTSQRNTKVVVTHNATARSGWWRVSTFASLRGQECHRSKCRTVHVQYVAVPYALHLHAVRTGCANTTDWVAPTPQALLGKPPAGPNACIQAAHVSTKSRPNARSFTKAIPTERCRLGTA